MKKACLVLFNVNLNIINFDDYDLIVGVDKGAYNLALNNIHMDIALGDFDSVDNVDIIYKYADKVIKLNPIKDETDTNEAIKLVDGYDITIFGGIKGKRIEHFYAILLDLINHENIKLIDDNSLIEIIKDNNYKIRSGYKYISLFSVDETILSLQGFKYNLNNYKLNRFDPLCISNEIISNPVIDIKSGKLIVIYSKED